MNEKKSFIGKIASLVAAVAGVVAPAPSAQVAQDGVQVQASAPQQTKRAPATQAPRANSGTQQALRFAGDGLYGGLFVRPFAPWAAPLYNQRKARRAARRQGRPVRRS